VGGTATSPRRRSDRVELMKGAGRTTVPRDPITGVSRRTRLARLDLVRRDRSHADVQRLAGAAGLAAVDERREREVRAARGGVVGSAAGGALKRRHQDPSIPAPSRSYRYARAQPPRWAVELPSAWECRRHRERGMTGELGQARRGRAEPVASKAPLHPYHGALAGHGTRVPAVLPCRTPFHPHSGDRSPLCSAPASAA
jgi:hypothetical protein